MAPSVDMDLALRELILGSATMHPDELPPLVRDLAERVGGRDVELLVVELDQQRLFSLFDDGESHPVNGSEPGDAYRFTKVVRSTVADGSRLWVPVMDSAERVGVLGVTVPQDAPDLPWRTLASLTGELVVAKARYGDHIPIARRRRSTSLAAEMRWAMLPPLTFRSPNLCVTGILEPAYEIAGDTFDYAVNGDIVHLAILDAMGHGLEASRMANVAVASYRHSRRHGLSLQDTARALDEAVRASYDRSRYITGQLATLDHADGSFRMLNMGHPLPLLLRDGAVVGELPSQPMLPAGWGDKPAAIYHARLEPGDQVLMYTDGVTEARHHSGELYGQERLGELVDASLATSSPPEEILRRIIEDTMAFQDHHARDDATLLLLTFGCASTGGAVGIDSG